MGGEGCRRKHSSLTMCPGSELKGYAVACVHPHPLLSDQIAPQISFLGGRGRGKFDVHTVSNAIFGLSF